MDRKQIFCWRACRQSQAMYDLRHWHWAYRSISQAGYHFRPVIFRSLKKNRLWKWPTIQIFYQRVITKPPKYWPNGDSFPDRNKLIDQRLCRYIVNYRCLSERDVWDPWLWKWFQWLCVENWAMNWEWGCLLRFNWGDFWVWNRLSSWVVSWLRTQNCK